jgi:hypothetical protein
VFHLKLSWGNFHISFVLPPFFEKQSFHSLIMPPQKKGKRKQDLDADVVETLSKTDKKKKSAADDEVADLENHMKKNVSEDSARILEKNSEQREEYPSERDPPASSTSAPVPQVPRPVARPSPPEPSEPDGDSKLDIDYTKYLKAGQSRKHVHIDDLTCTQMRKNVDAPFSVKKGRWRSRCICGCASKFIDNYCKFMNVRQGAQVCIFKKNFISEEQKQDPIGG